MLDRDLLELAGRQHGVLGHHQLRREYSVSQPRIARMHRSGVLRRFADGVAILASAPETEPARCWALQLRYGERGFVSGWTAGRLYGLRSMPAARAHFTIPAGVRRSAPPWAEIHRSRWFAEEDRRVLDGLYVATPLRMLFGLAAAFTQFRFERAAEDAWHRGLITPVEAARYLEEHRCSGKDGVATMERWLVHATTQSAPAASGLERDLLGELELAGLPPPVRQHPLELRDGRVVRIDIAWPDVRLGIEPGDSWWHGGDLGQRRDQARDRACNEVGWVIARFDESMRDDLRGSARQVARIYHRRRHDVADLP